MFGDVDDVIFDFTGICLLKIFLLLFDVLFRKFAIHWSLVELWYTYYMKQNEPKRIIHNNLLHYMLRDCFDKCKSLQVVRFCNVSTLVCNRSHIFLNYEEGNPGQLAFQFSTEVYACGDTNCMFSVALLFDSLLAKILYVYYSWSTSKPSCYISP